MRAIEFKDNKLFYIDQRLLPGSFKRCRCRDLSQGISAIETLAVRGAPLIGVFAAYCLYLWAYNYRGRPSQFLRRLRSAAGKLNRSRPTAVNLSWALERVLRCAAMHAGEGPARMREAVLKEARRIHAEDIELCTRIGRLGASLIGGKDSILTHCNAGFLATSGDGTALSVFYAARKQGKDIKVYADETRPLLQGARLSAWELSQNGVDCTLICDNTAAWLMAQGKINKVFVGADRIAANGDTANKIGTYAVALAARYHKIPFYIAAPFSTFDLKISTGKGIPIEERNPDEVRKVLNKINIAPSRVPVSNPAFDVTPARLIAAIITDKGIIRPPFKKNIRKVL